MSKDTILINMSDAAAKRELSTVEPPDCGCDCNECCAICCRNCRLNLPHGTTNTFHVLLTDANGFHSCEIDAESIIDCEQKIKEQFPTASYWEIGFDA